eukprot:TRINITY_DN6537_c0_g5_i1.p1 TRINITY_DN6537_c0_g5~~TRINITY_DN6537_c0_g5_i1.p1  ORF type:complete len:109 (+),score=1.21 TRINITY_DN6537_c0_g5_i1:280-606(+)
MTSTPRMAQFGNTGVLHKKTDNVSFKFSNILQLLVLFTPKKRCMIFLCQLMGRNYRSLTKPLVFSYPLRKIPRPTPDDELRLPGNDTPLLSVLKLIPLAKYQQCTPHL